MVIEKINLCSYFISCEEIRNRFKQNLRVYLMMISFSLDSFMSAPLPPDEPYPTRRIMNM